MKKKYLRPVPKTETTKKEGNADERVSRRKFTVKKLIIILLAVLVACTAVIVPVCVVYVDIPVKPSFADFSQQNDYSITVKWNKIAAATSYELEYCHSDPNEGNAEIIKGSTEQNRFTMQRYAGDLYFRVRAVKKNRKGQFSEWIHYEIEAWTLTAPKVTINSASLLASWTSVNYRYYNDYSPIAPAYIYSYGWQLPDEETVWNYDLKSIAPNISLLAAVFTHSHFRDYYQGLEYEWPGDMTVKIRVAALNYSLYNLDFTKYVDSSPKSEALNQIYNEVGAYGESELLITQEIFDALPKK